MTAFTDAFTKLDSNVVGSSLTFTDLLNDLQNVSNRAEMTVAAATGRSRAEHDTDWHDQYGLVIVALGTPSSNTSEVAVGLRYSAVADTGYLLIARRVSGPVTTLLIQKMVAGAPSTLEGPLTVPGLATGDSLRFEANGSWLTGYQNGVPMLGVRDLSIPTGRRSAIHVRAGTAATRTTTYIDYLEYGDLDGSGVGRWGNVAI